MTENPNNDPLRKMLDIRHFEQRIQTLFTEGHVRGTTHLASGQEAVAVGSAAALQSNDPVFCTYRGHHHCLARGMPPAAAFAEILGRAEGCCGGKGGSMHLADPSRGLFGSYAIVGSHLPLAVGAAWASSITSDGAVTCCFFGDGTTTIGAFHESLNLAAVWRLPVIFVCENNGYSEYTRIDDVVPVKRPAADRARAYGLEPIVVDGNSVDDVAEAVGAARSRAADGLGPSLIEALTYRHSGHSRADPGKYRPEAEVAAWLARDPVELYIACHAVPDSQVDRTRKESLDAIDKAAAEALASPEPSPEALLAHVFGSPT